MDNNINLIKEYLAKFESIELDSIENHAEKRQLLACIAGLAQNEMSNLTNAAKALKADLPGILKRALKRRGRGDAVLQMSKFNGAGSYIMCWIDRDTANEIEIEFTRVENSTREQTESAFESYLNGVL